MDKNPSKAPEKLSAEPPRPSEQGARNVLTGFLFIGVAGTVVALVTIVHADLFLGVFP